MSNMKKRITFFLLSFAIILTFTGCRLARDSVAQEEARMIGVFITSEHLNLFDHSLEGQVIHMRQRRSDLMTSFQPGRLYAEWDETIGDFIFRDVEGIPFFTAMSPSHSHDEIILSHVGTGISSGGNHVSFGDNSVSIAMEGTVYIVPGTEAMSIIHMNPVFQTSDRRVFLTTGNAFSGHGLDTEGRIFSTNLTESKIETINGIENTNSISITVNVASMFPPEQIIFLEMDEFSQIIMRTEFPPAETPKTFYPEAQTSYIIVETHRNRSCVLERTKRELVAQGRHGQRISTFTAREDGILEENWTEIVWSNQG